MKNYLDKPIYKKNFNEGQKNLKEIFTGTIYGVPNILVVSLVLCLNVLFVLTHL